LSQIFSNDYIYTVNAYQINSSENVEQLNKNRGRRKPYGTPMYLLLLSLLQPCEEKVPLEIPIYNDNLNTRI